MIQAPQTTRGTYYESIEAKVLEARKRFRLWTESLPQPIGEVIMDMAKGNVEASLHGNLLGERNAFWLGELFGADEELQQLAALGCIAGYAFVIQQDYQIDEGEEATLHQELAKNYLSRKTTQTFQAVAQNHEMFWGYWNQYLNQYTLGCLAEAADGATPRVYTPKDLTMVANRSALVKIVAASFALATAKTSEIPKYEQAVENLIIGLQIRDDLADCIEDFRRGRYTYVMSRLLAGEAATELGLQRAALCSGTIGELLQESTDFLSTASSLLGLRRGNALQLYISHVVDENDAIKEEVSQARKTQTFSLKQLQNKIRMDY
ncbi:class 1 isoprenoid biosynthesis enzyme [Patescibacteria group bacterium]|nr:class 1 isoprenoid biosynthesis enzyme [Patescibacteria group bacterium]